MNNLYAQELINKATQAGVPREKIAALLERAENIASRKTKTASAKFNLIEDLLKEAGMAKSASSESYVNGILNEALMNGANLPQAMQFTKRALDATNERLAFMEKVSAIQANPQLNQWAEGFMTSAKQAGLKDEEAVSLMVDVVDREKQAGDPSQLFQQAPGGPGASGGAGGPPPMDPSAGAGVGGPPSPGGDPGQGGGKDEEAQILQMLQSLPPEEQQAIIQQLLSAIQGGQGGPGGGVPPGGPGGAPQPGPQGPPQ